MIGHTEIGTLIIAAFIVLGSLGGLGWWIETFANWIRR